MAVAQSERSKHLLPFQPLPFRDFMLYEKHVIEASLDMRVRHRDLCQ
jgi:hypothetical protein